MSFSRTSRLIGPAFEHATVADAMRIGIISCQADTSLRAIAELMASYHVHAVVVETAGVESGARPGRAGGSCRTSSLRARRRAVSCRPPLASSLARGRCLSDRRAAEARGGADERASCQPFDRLYGADCASGRDHRLLILPWRSRGAGVNGRYCCSGLSSMGGASVLSQPWSDGWDPASLLLRRW